MDDQTRAEINAFFRNPPIQGALSGLGLFAIDFVGRRAFPSSVWLKAGYTGEDMLENRLDDILHDDDRDRLLGKLQDLFAGRCDRVDDVFRLRTRWGTWLWIAGNFTVVYRDDHGTPLLYVGHDLDVTEIKEREEEASARLKEIETLRQVIADVNTSLEVGETVSLILKHTQRVIPYDRGSVQLLEGPALRVVGTWGFHNPQAILDSRFVPLGNPCAEALETRRPVVCNDVAQGFPTFVQMVPEAPTKSWLGIPLIVNHEVIGLMALDSTVGGFYTPHHREVAEIFAGHIALAMDKARMFEAVQSLSVTDPLTGVGNRRSLQLHGPFFEGKARREQTRLVALMVDFDHFKRVNDDFGHEVGDTVLKDGAEVIRQCLRTYDLFVRYGGEEFLILLPDASSQDCWEIAERIRLAVEAHRFQGLDRTQTVSIGIGLLVPNEVLGLNDVIKAADEALYQSKQTGRNRTTASKL